MLTLTKFSEKRSDQNAYFKESPSSFKLNIASNRVLFSKC